MADIKSIEIKSISLLSVFKYFGGVFMVVGLIIGLFGNILKINALTAEFVRIFPFMAKIGPGIPSGLTLAAICGLSAGVIFSVFALLYNLFAGILGGIRFFIIGER